MHAAIGSSVSVLAGIEGIELLDAGVRHRFNTLKRETDRQDFLAARVLAKLAMGKVTGLRPALISIEQSCADCNGLGHGKPFFPSHPELSVSWSHQNGIVMAAVSSFDIGVDVETLSSIPVDPDFAKNVLSNGEMDIFNRLPAASFDSASLKQLYVARQWVRKEAIIKLGGCSLDRLSELDLGELEFPDFSLGAFHRINSGCVYAMMDVAIANPACLAALVWRAKTRGAY
ncbi:4'-phosphopantetheinyl transferase family protein [Cupriavidus oxalaticus]|uniref:4'-phosphopantetheinyl transferase family protein n=1 Tax=Cupriavidus oxalaticus TaxID=96344 RepID=UPI00142EAEDF|nr:4'-phosphopantetheinyl transferase superfamily protein [Cupriavidus oxalaticus]